MIKAGIRKLLIANPVAHALAGDRIYFGMAHQDERRPRIVISLISAAHEHTFTGHAGYVTGTLECACLAGSYGEAKALAAKVIAALDGYEGPVEGVPGLAIQYLTVESENDIPAVVPEGAPVPETCGVSVLFNFMILK